MNAHQAAAAHGPDGEQLAATADVAIVGAGPVGLVTALLLADRGHEVALVERWPAPYPLPRASGITHEILRCLQSARVIDDVLPGILFTEDGVRRFEMRSGTGEVLLVRIDRGTSVSGWPERASFSQPEFERTLNDRVRVHPRIRLFRGWEVTQVHDDGSGVIVDAVGWEGHHTGTLRVGARYLVGSDGANSVVRSGELAVVEDLGFAHDWLVVDVVLPEGRVITPHLAQIFGPPRPTTLVSGGPGGRRRWEFMRLQGESLDDLNSTEKAWRLLAPYDVHSGNARLERHAVYTFRGRWSVQWRSGRRILAGDAAHLMPVFLGEGFNSGLRDAVALAWRLDLVLRGICPEELLDSYVAERLGHVRQVVEQAVEAGKVICVLDPVLAAERDDRLRAEPDGLMPEHKRRDWRLGPGLWQPEDRHAGYLAVQGRVSAPGGIGLFDDVVDHRGFVLVVVGNESPPEFAPSVQAAWARLGGITVHIAGDSEIADLEGTYAEWFAARAIVVALIRPDFYVYATCPSLDRAEDLVVDLLKRTGARLPAPEGSVLTRA